MAAALIRIIPPAAAGKQLRLALWSNTNWIINSYLLTVLLLLVMKLLHTRRDSLYLIKNRIHKIILMKSYIKMTIIFVIIVFFYPHFLLTESLLKN